MVRFVRLTSWRSWDLLNVDSGILEFPAPELNLQTDCQVRRLRTDTRDGVVLRRNRINYTCRQ